MDLFREIFELRKSFELLKAENGSLRERVSALEAENSELRRRLNQDSGNSGNPPSSDPIWKRTVRPSKKKKNGRSPGAQKGHKGNKLKKFEEVDYCINHTIDCCPSCSSENLSINNSSSKQVVDIPLPKIQVIEHVIYDYECQDCGTKTSSSIKKDFKQEVQYGPNIKALVSYLNVYQLIPYKRLTEMINHLYDHKISQGSVSNFNKELSGKLGGFMDRLKEEFIHSEAVFHSDETGCMVEKALHWVHVYSNATKTLLVGHSKRGRQAMDDINILPQAKGTVIHDRFNSYNGYEQLEHGLCNAHILRELKALEQNKELQWPGQIKKLLLRAKEYKDQDDLNAKRIQRIQNRYESILRKQRPYYQKVQKLINDKKARGKPKRSKDHNLFLALWKSRNDILRFIHNEDVPFDNNQAERDLRMFKVKMKISNLFKSSDWLNVHATIRSYISTVAKKKMDILYCIEQAYNNPKFAAQMAV